MQTFLTLQTTNFDLIAQTLDNKRLHKQALEGWQILMTLVQLDPDGNDRTPKGWVNHPAVLMWKGHESALLAYITAMVKEWRNRGYQSSILEKAIKTYVQALRMNRTGLTGYPDWMRDPDRFERVASSHRRALLAKNYAWYSQFEWKEDEGFAPTGYEYVWELPLKSVTNPLPTYR